MNSDSPRGEVEAEAKATPEPRLKKFIAQQVDKVADRVWTAIFAGLAIVLPLVWQRVSIFSSAIGNPRVAPWLFSLLSIPAIFGMVVFIRWLFWRRAPSLYVTVDPEQSFCQETLHAHTPALFVCLRATFTNTGLADELVMYAYPRGTKSLSHFYEPISLPPETATLDVDVDFICTLPAHALKDPYSTTFIFVDAGGRKYRQRLSLKLQPKAVPSAPEPVSPSLERPTDAHVAK